MIQNEFYMTRSDGVDLYRTYSDAGMMIQQEQTGVLYSEAIDVAGSAMTYVETDTPIEGSDDDEELSDAEALNILMGGE